MKQKILSILLVATLSLSMTACISKDDSSDESTYESSTNVEEKQEAENFATKDNPADIRTPTTITDMWGTYTIQLLNVYVGDDALNQLKSMGEDVENFTPINSGGKTVLFEYQVSADKGYDENPFLGSDIFGNDMWSTDMKSKYEYSVFDLYENASLDYYQLELNTGEESKMYMVQELPGSVNQFVSSFSGNDEEYWFLYDLNE